MANVRNGREWQGLLPLPAISITQYHFKPREVEIMPRQSIPHRGLQFLDRQEHFLPIQPAALEARMLQDSRLLRGRGNCLPSSST